MDRRAKKKHNAFCRLASIYSCDLSQLDYERTCALWYTRSDAKYRQASTIRLAVNSVGSKLPLSWFLANFDTADEAHFQYERHCQAIDSLRSSD